MEKNKLKIKDEKPVDFRYRAHIFRSNKAISCQIVDNKGNTLAAVSSINIKTKIKPVEKAHQIGQALAKIALDKKVKFIKFDRNGYKYHGQVKALAQGMREGGLIF